MHKTLTCNCSHEQIHSPYILRDAIAWRLAAQHGMVRSKMGVGARVSWHLWLASKARQDASRKSGCARDCTSSMTLSFASYFAPAQQRSRHASASHDLTCLYVSSCVRLNGVRVWADYHAHCLRILRRSTDYLSNDHAPSGAGSRFRSVAQHQPYPSLCNFFAERRSWRACVC